MAAAVSLTGSRMNVRSALYLAARLMGDARALQTGTVTRRVVRRLAGKMTGRMLRRLG